MELSKDSVISWENIKILENLEQIINILEGLGEIKLSKNLKKIKILENIETNRNFEKS